MNKIRFTYDDFIEWRERHISEKHLVLILSLMVGCLSSLAAFLLKTLIFWIEHLLDTHLAAQNHIWYLIFPMMGIALASLFVHFIVKDDISHGITKVLYAISQRKSIIKLHNTWSSLVSSVITIGFGGSVGAEAPIVLTGAAIGSNLAKAFRLDQKTLMLMIGCGAAGAIGGIFKAPIAGLVFTLEVLLMDLTMTSLAPLLISSVTATALSYLLTGTGSMFALETIEPFVLERIPWYLLLGIVCGLFSLYFIRATTFLEQLFKHKVQSLWLKIVIGGCVLGILIYLFPPLYGEGYLTISALLNGQADMLLTDSALASLFDNPWLLLVYIFAIILLKVVASVAT
ncbi:MAG: chloride channel protein, partial [Paludibacteraceae bacterium]|nr:chloride channel protein [Paludibacteraceae bacterium]